MADIPNNETDAQEQAGFDNLAESLAPSSDDTFITTEPKSVNRSTIVLFAILIAAACGVYFMYLRTGPASARAATPSSANQTISQFLDSRTHNVALMHQLLRNTEKIIQQFTRYPTVTQVPLSQLHTNPFIHGSAKPDDASGSSRQGGLSRSAALKAVSALNLQSILHGAKRSACLINNTLYQEGQSIDSILIERITPNSIIVKTGNYRFELKMLKPTDH